MLATANRGNGSFTPIFASHIWSSYRVGSDDRQQISSKKTSRKQVARCFSFAVKSGLISQGTRVFDLGCGHDNSLNRTLVQSVGGVYACCDLYNLDINENLSSIQLALTEGVDLVIISNVLNVIREVEVRQTLLLQAKELLAGSGGLLVGVYEGVPLAAEKKMGIKGSASLSPTITKDGWQNRKKTAEYLKEIQVEFPNAELIYGRGKSDAYIASRLS
ncbi:hypothetical protein OTK49_02300 [Vibrio coralliirubri]|uniref:hypothetical protein n=1 Tax=Vibrio coralliirubri TaxID=1516159 RepID=UPI002284E363|nr:hypothetical protein [Vibrio coralliirubri]MCY9861347.1 hypothetical protein [Vibrio coralliirubri]